MDICLRGVSTQIPFRSCGSKELTLMRRVFGAGDLVAGAEPEVPVVWAIKTDDKTSDATTTTAEFIKRSRTILLVELPQLVE